MPPKPVNYQRRSGWIGLVTFWFVWLYVYACVSTCVSTCVCVCVGVRVCVCVCVVCVCVCAEKSTVPLERCAARIFIPEPILCVSLC
jgi:hypothetical protein